MPTSIQQDSKTMLSVNYEGHTNVSSASGADNYVNLEQMSFTNNSNGDQVINNNASPRVEEKDALQSVNVKFDDGDELSAKNKLVIQPLKTTNDKNLKSTSPLPV